MTTIKTSYNRRSFLQVSSAAGGGMLLGFSFLAGCRSDVVEQKVAELVMPDTWFDMNGYIRIGNNGVVTILSPNPEIGQNVKTSMPMLVAEELDVDWKQVVVEQAGLDTKNFQRQIAGGSQSIRKGWKSLRTAGATARRMLMEAAAQKWTVPIEELTTESGVIHHAASSRTLGYGEVADAAASIAVPEEVVLKEPKDFKIIGKAIPNVDGPDLVQGKPIFGMDYEEEGMLYAMVTHPPAFGMKVGNYNQEEVAALPGITAVFDIETDFFGENRFAKNALKKNTMIAVVGDSTWEVMQARKQLKVDWVQSSKGESSRDHDAQLTAMLNQASEPLRKDGDFETAYRAAAQTIERTYTAPFLAHNTMAPMNFFADVTTTAARFVGSIQTPEMSAELLSEALAIPLENISIMMTRMGGGFGRRLYAGWLFESALISRKVGKPIKLIYSREDDMTKGTYRPAYKVRYRAALDKNNKLVAFHVKGAGAHGGPVWQNRFPAGAVPHYQAEDSSMETNISTGAWRAPKSNFIAGAEQAFIDEIAELAGKDPIDLRIELFEQAKSTPVGEENDYDPDRYIGVLNLVKDKSNWGKESPGIHRGVAAYYCHNSYVAQVVDIIKVDGKPKIQKVWCAVDCGTVVNPTGARNQLEGGTIDGIGIAMYGGMTFTDGKPDQSNFHDYQMIRHSDAPAEIETFFVDNGIEPTGLGEPGLPPVIGALANALYQATGQRYYDQPFSKQSALLG